MIATLPAPDAATTVSAPSVSTADPVILDQVSKQYGRGRHAVTALSNVSFSFPRGSVTAVMGISGSGKSTLLACAAGLERPSAGRIRLCGTELRGLSERRLAILRRRHVGFVFQDLNLLPSLTVAENIALPLRLDHRAARQQEIAAAAARVGLDQLRRLPSELSGGQQQRVAVARALVTRPDVIFADEPTASLDPPTGRGVLRLLREAADGATVVIVTHDPLVTRYCDQAVFLLDGQIDRVVQRPDPAQVAALLDRMGDR